MRPGCPRLVGLTLRTRHFSYFLFFRFINYYDYYYYFLRAFFFCVCSLFSKVIPFRIYLCINTYADPDR